MKYRKKPIEVESIQFTGENLSDVENFVGSKSVSCSNSSSRFVITKSFTMFFTPTDWIIKEHGNFRPVDSEEFNASHEPVE